MCCRYAAYNVSESFSSYLKIYNMFSLKYNVSPAVCLFNLFNLLKQQQQGWIQGLGFQYGSLLGWTTTWRMEADRHRHRWLEILVCEMYSLEPHSILSIHLHSDISVKYIHWNLIVSLILSIHLHPDICVKYIHWNLIITPVLETAVKSILQQNNVVMRVLTQEV